MQNLISTCLSWGAAGISEAQVVLCTFLAALLAASAGLRFMLLLCLCPGHQVSSWDIPHIRLMFSRLGSWVLKGSRMSPFVSGHVWMEAEAGSWG